MIKVSLIEDDKEYREALAKVVKSSNKLSLLSQDENCEKFLKNLKDEKPDVLLLEMEYMEPAYYKK